MSKVVGAFDPTLASNGKVETGLLGQGYVLVHNLSPCDVLFSDDYGNSFMSYANSARLWRICNTTPVLFWAVEENVYGTANPTKLIYIEAYTFDEDPTNTYPQTYSRASAIQGTVDTTLTGAVPIYNADGTILTMSPQGGAMPVSGGVAINNQPTVAVGNQPTVGVASNQNINVWGLYTFFNSNTPALNTNTPLNISRAFSVNATGLLIVSNQAVNNYSVTITDQAGNVLYNASGRAQPQFNLIPLVNDASIVTWTVTINTAVAASFRYYTISGALPSTINSAEGFNRNIELIVGTGFALAEVNVPTGDNGTVRASYTPTAGRVGRIKSIDWMHAPVASSANLVCMVRVVNAATGVMSGTLVRTINGANEAVKGALACDIPISPSNRVEIVTVNSSGGTIFFHISLSYIEVPQ